MNNNEKDILTLAAKAAGYTLDHYYKYTAEAQVDGLIVAAGQLEGHTSLWKPHKDDAQCLQLARLLGINIDYADFSAWKRMANGTLFQEYFSMSGDGDWPSDKEAVVAVAAELGRKL